MSYLRDAWYAYVNASALYAGATASTLGFGAARWLYTGHGGTFRTGVKMADLGLRMHFNAMRGVMSTPVSRGGNLTVGRAAIRGTSAVAAGYMLGAAATTAYVGSEHADFMGGTPESRQSLALDLFMPGGASFIEDALFKMPQNVSAIWNRFE